MGERMFFTEEAIEARVEEMRQTIFAGTDGEHAEFEAGAECSRRIAEVMILPFVRQMCIEMNLGTDQDVLAVAMVESIAWICATMVQGAGETPSDKFQALAGNIQLIAEQAAEIIAIGTQPYSEAAHGMDIEGEA